MYCCLAAVALEEEVSLMFIGAAGQSTTDPQRAVVNPLPKKEESSNPT